MTRPRPAPASQLPTLPPSIRHVRQAGQVLTRAGAAVRRGVWGTSGSGDQGIVASSCAKLPVAGVTATPDDGNVPANTIDGNLSTRWSSNGIGSFIRYDLGAAVTVCNVSIAWYRGDVRSSNFVISTSVDGSTFSTAFQS